MQIVWVDAFRCTGCGACVEVCPIGVITLVDSKAHVDGEMCTGCGVCVDACSVDAIQRVIQGELIPAPEHPAAAVYHPGPMARTAGATLAVAGTGLLMKAAGALARSLGRWLMRQPQKLESPTGAITSREKRMAGRRRRMRWGKRGR